VSNGITHAPIPPFAALEGRGKPVVSIAPGRDPLSEIFETLPRYTTGAVSTSQKQPR